jgi:flagellar biosynthetic protein FliO
VVGYKNKIVAFVTVIALGGGALVVCSGQTPETESKRPSLSSYSLSGTDPNYSSGSADTRELFLKMMAAVLLVIVLGVAAIYVSKKFLPKITNLPGKKIRIVETVHLGPRKTIHLLEVGNHRLLVGSTSDSITALADVTVALADLPSQDTEEEVEDINDRW